MPLLCCYYVLTQYTTQHNVYSKNYYYTPTEWFKELEKEPAVLSRAKLQIPHNANQSQTTLTLTQTL